jgi:hypothetical protein
MLAADGPATTVSLSDSEVHQAGALMVSASDGVSGTATVFGRSYPLVQDGNGLVGFLGFGTDDPPGETVVSLDLTDALGEAQHYDWTVTVLATQWTVDYIDLPPSTDGLLDPGIDEAEFERLEAIYSEVTPKKWNGDWIVPVDAPVSGYFGEQRSYNGGPVEGHHGGTDFGANEGDPIHAANDGVVVLAEPLQVRGNMVIIDHGGGVFTGYAHMKSFAVAEGDHVTKGQVIGYVDSTGLATGPHLHWEMAVDGILVDGLRWTDGSQGF